MLLLGHNNVMILYDKSAFSEKIYCFLSFFSICFSRTHTSPHSPHITHREHHQHNTRVTTQEFHHSPTSPPTQQHNSPLTNNTTSPPTQHKSLQRKILRYVFVYNRIFDELTNVMFLFSRVRPTVRGGKLLIA